MLVADSSCITHARAAHGECASEGGHGDFARCTVAAFLKAKPEQALVNVQVAKFLMSNAAAGGIIGKQGANITELQNQSAARLQLSRANEFFPGTEDRVLICSGTVNQVLTALHLVLNRVQTELVSPNIYIY